MRVHGSSSALADMQEAEMKAKAQPQPKYRKDYKPTPYLVDKISLDFNLNDDSTKVVARSHVKPNNDGACQHLLPCTAACERMCQVLRATLALASQATHVSEATAQCTCTAGHLARHAPSSARCGSEKPLTRCKRCRGHPGHGAGWAQRHAAAVCVHQR